MTRLLRRIATAAAAALRQPDLVARSGGEELIVSSCRPIRWARFDVAERIRAAGAVPTAAVAGFRGRHDVSVGVASLLFRDAVARLR